MSHQDSPSHAPRDELLTILADDRCRAILSHFQDSAADVATVGELVDEISKQDHGGAERAAIQFHHSVLPRMADTGVVDYDARSTTVRYRGHPELEAMADGIAER